MSYPTGLIRSDVLMAQPFAMPLGMRLERRDVPETYSMEWATPIPMRQLHNDCVACAVAAAFQTQEDRAYYSAMPDGRHWLLEYSPAWLYGCYHLQDSQDTGATFGRMLSILRKGIATARGWPYGTNAWRRLPSDGLTIYPGPREFYNVYAWGQPPDLAAIRRELSLGRPVLIGSWSDDGWQRYKGGDLAPVTEKSGAHATFLYGYDGHGVFGQNSWGTAWGEGGRYHMPWGVVERDVFEAWVMNLAGQVQGMTDAARVAERTAHDQREGR